MSLLSLAAAALVGILEMPLAVCVQGHNASQKADAFLAEGIAKGNRYMIEAFLHLLKCETCGS